ncbi:type 1 fimbrial protein [Enterobacter bugandensis]|nr:type 1 fimbrial protein [Enterobacter bugandensis]EKS7120166.1 type 1 fimbrial protein [Enterobacter bugandensis]
MKLNLIFLATTIAMGMSSSVYASGGGGKISFSGSIIDAACSVAPESEDQAISLGQITSSQLGNGGTNDGKSKPRNFEIKLENCTTTTKNSVTTTFTGSPSAYDSDSLGVTGSGGGVSIVLTDGSGTKIALGKETAPTMLADGNNTLRFAAYVEGGGTSATITEGDFSAVAGFTLTYP